jgi:hypothetical protein
VVTEIETMLLDVVRAELEDLSRGVVAVRVPLDLLARSVVASCLATLIWWVGEQFRQSPEEVEALFQAIVAPGVRATFPVPR